MRIFLAPRSNETSYKNFLSTIENGVVYNIVEPFLTSEGKKVLSGQSKLFAWGNKESKKSSWDKMESGDLILFYKGREGNENEGKFVYAGRLLYKQHDRNLGLTLWPPKPKEDPWTCVYFLQGLTSIYLPISDIRLFGGYDKKFDRIQGFMPLNDTGTKRIMAEYQSLDAFVNQYRTENKSNEKSDLVNKNEKTAHAEIQMLLLRTGLMLGYDTYCPNKSNIVDGDELRKYITLDKLPTRYFGDENVIKLVSQIDVIWFKDEKPINAFEVENTTKVGSGLQRLFPLNEYGSILFVIAPGVDEKDKLLFNKFMNNDPYFKQKKSFRFKTYKQVEMLFNSVSENTAIKNAFLGEDVN